MRTELDLVARSAGMLAIALVVGTALSPVAVANNFDDVYTSAKVTFTDKEDHVEARVEHCDGVLHYDHPSFCHEDAPGFDGFGFTDGRDPLVHVDCRYRLDGPAEDRELAVAVYVDGQLVDRICERTAEAGVELDASGVGHAFPPAPDENHWSDRIDVQAEIDSESSDSIGWNQSWLRDGPQRQVARIVDPSATDRYRSITGNATTTVLEDPTGDGRLLVHGEHVPVFDGVPVPVEDLLVIRTDTPDLGPHGKTWTITTPFDLPFLAQIRQVDDGHVTEIHTYRI